MPRTVDLTAKPYNLDVDQIRWVEDTLSRLTLEQKVGQLFVNLFFFGADEFSGNAVDERPDPGEVPHRRRPLAGRRREAVPGPAQQPAGGIRDPVAGRGELRFGRQRRVLRTAPTSPPARSARRQAIETVAYNAG